MTFSYDGNSIMLILAISVCAKLKLGVKLKLGEQMPDQMRLRREKRPDLGVPIL